MNPARRGWLAKALGLCSGLGACVSAPAVLAVIASASMADAEAMTRAPAEGGIVFLRARLERLGQGWLLDAKADIELPREIRTGLDNGVPLEFIVELEIDRPRPWWPDRRLLRQRWHYRLVYYELTRHYRVSELETGTSRNFRSLLPALDGLGTLRVLLTGDDDDVTDDSLTQAPHRTLAATGNDRRATLRMRLDSGALPLPLQPLLSSSWRLRTEQFSWFVAVDGARTGAAAN